MAPAVLLLLAALGAPVVLLPVDAPDLTDAQAREAAAALSRALPRGFEVVPPDSESAAARLSVAGASCQADLACACEVLRLEPGVPILALRVSGTGAAWAADLRLAGSCAGGADGRAARFLTGGTPALTRFLSEAVPGLLLGTPELAPPQLPAHPYVGSPPATPPSSSRQPAQQPSQGSTAAIAARGNGRFRAGDYRGAAADFAEALAQSPDDPILLYNLGQAWLRIGDASEARRYLKQFVATPPRAGDERLREESTRQLIDLER